MLETVTFPIVSCSACARRTLGAYALVDDDLQLVCSRCDAPSERPAQMLGASALSALGITVEGEGETKGCGSGDDGGGCSSCAKSDSCAA